MAKSALVVAPTGTGKTVVMGETCRRFPKPKRIMLLAHRDELIRQAAEKIGRMTGELCEIEKAELESNECSWTKKARIVVASVQTLNSQRNGKYRMEKFDPLEFGLLLTDEAHHATASTYRRVFDYFSRNPEIRHVGVTATPDRADEEALGQIYETVAFEYQIVDAINDGWLVPIEQQFVQVEGLDLSGATHKVTTNDRGDISDATIARIFKDEAILHRVVDPTFELAGDQQTIVFASSVDHAERMAEIFNRHRRSCAACIHGKTDIETRQRLLQKFSQGEFQFLCNMGVFLEGFDEPRIGVVAMARPTKSRSLYAQAIGRGTRPLPGVVDGLLTPEERRAAIANSPKTSVLCLDFVGNSGRHKLCCTADILGGNETDAVVEKATANAKKKAARGERVNMQVEIEVARHELEEEHREARRSVIAKAKFSTKAVNPFDVFDIVPRREPGWHKGRKPTAGQVSALERFKVDRETIEKMSFCQASQALDELCKRAKEGRCTLKQAKILARFGLDTNVSFDEASGMIDQLAKNKWKAL